MNKVFAVMALLFVPIPVLAENYYQPGGSQQTKCYKNVYREEYVPGTRNSPGYVKKFNERVEVPCENQARTQPYTPQRDVDDNSCVEGSIIGGILGGAAGGTLATKKNWIWSIPTGVVGGALVGCQVDGG